MPDQELAVSDKRRFLDRPLTEADISDASISTLERATILRVPHAEEVATFLDQIHGRPLSDNVLVLPLPPDDHYGAIVIPKIAEEDQVCGIVVAVGKGRMENGVLTAPDVRRGNYVVFSKYSAKPVDLSGIRVLQVAEGDITFAAGE